MTDRVKLELHEVMVGAISGVMRTLENIKTSAKPRYGATNKNAWQISIDGAIGELVVAKYLNIYYAVKGKKRGPDVGHYQVRSSQNDNARLILHEDDKDDEIFFLVTGVFTDFQVHGWCYARDGKKPEYWQDPGTSRPAYFVPKAMLNNEKPPQGD